MKTLRYCGAYRFVVPDTGEFRDHNDVITAPAELLTEVSAVSSVTLLVATYVTSGSGNRRISG